MDIMPENFIKAIATQRGISDAEREVLSFAINGILIAEIANKLEIEQNAVRTRLGEVYRAFDIPGRGPGKLVKLKAILAELYQKSANQMGVSPTEASSEAWLAVLPPLPKSVVESELSPTQPQTTSQSYIKLPILECCYKEILNPGALIVIKAPWKMGKTLLMSEILNYAKSKGYRTIALSLRLAEKTDVETLDNFLKWFCTSITAMLRLEKNENLDVENHWKTSLGNSKVKCMSYLEKFLSYQNQPLVLGLDDLDLVFPHSEIATDFLAMLRTWYEEAITQDNWSKLRQVLVYTEEYIPLDINLSPFNIGMRIKLEDLQLNADQVQNLAKHYGIDLNMEDVTSIRDMVGGHPYLLEIAIKRMALQSITLEDLLKTAPTEAGVYGEHLRRLQRYLQKPDRQDNTGEYPMVKILEEVVRKEPNYNLDSKWYIEKQKLIDLGILQWEDNGLTPRLPLYEEYFGLHIKKEDK